MLRAGGNCRNIDDTTILRRVRQFYVAPSQTVTAAKNTEKRRRRRQQLKISAATYVSIII